MFLKGYPLEAKIALKTEKLEFDLENLAGLAEIWKFYALFQNTFENFDIASLCHTDCEPICFDFH